MRWLIAALAVGFLLGEAKAAPKSAARTDAPKALESAAARDEAQALSARQQAQDIEAQRQAASAAAVYAAALRAREEGRAEAAGAAAQRALAGIGAKGADAQSASARAALAAAASATRRKAQGEASTIAQSEVAFKAHEMDIAALIRSLEEEADAFEARASAQRALAAKQRERLAAEALARRIAQAAKRSTPVRGQLAAQAHKAVARAAPAPQAFPKFAAAPVLIEGGGQVTRVFGAQQAGGPKSTGILLAPQRLGAQIAAPIAGKVLHAGPLRHLGMVLIMDAGNGYVLVFGGLEEVPLKTGAQISRGDRIGHLPRTAESALYFEVRHNGISIDPASWSMLRS